MTQPVAYTPATNFQQEETNAVAGRSTARTSALDAELQAVSLTLSQILTNLALIQRDDTQLKDLVVTTASLSANVKALFAGGINPRGIWLTATSYAVKDVVETGTPFVSYVCVTAHTSGVFATDRTAGKWMVLGSEAGLGTFTSIVLSTGGITLSTNNTQDLAASGSAFRTGYFRTSVDTPLVTAPSGNNLRLNAAASQSVLLQIAGSTIYSFDATEFDPQSDNVRDLGAATLRWKRLFTPIIDSGTAGSLSARVNNGETIATFNRNGTTVNFFEIFGGSAGTSGFIRAAGETNVSMVIRSKGNGSVTLQTDGSGTPITQFDVLHAASANRNITVTGSNGGNPTIGVTAGNLAITPNIVLGQAVSKIIPGATSLSLRNNADGADNLLITDAGDVTIRGTSYIGDTSNAFATLGLTINQAGADNEILSLKSTDVAHGVTATTETDTFGIAQKFQTAAGGLMITGLNSGNNAGLYLRAIHVTDDVAKSNAGLGCITIDGTLKSGTSPGAMGANANILSVGTNGTTRFLLDADGDSHQDVGTAWTNFDEHDDVALLDAIAVAVARAGDPLREAFIAELESRRSQIEALPGKAIVTFNEDGHHFVNMSRLVMLQHGAIRQLASRLSTMERKLLQ